MKEGKRLKYYHISKHGGTWVYDVLSKMFDEVEDKKSPPIRVDNDEKFLTVSVYRNPFNWYKSVHAFYLFGAGEKNNYKFVNNVWFKDCWRNELNDFIKNIMSIEKGFLTKKYTILSSICDHIGTTENLRKDLAYFLDITGHEYDKAVIENTPAKQVASGLPEYMQELTNESKSLIEQFEGDAIKMWEEVYRKTQNV